MNSNKTTELVDVKSRKEWRAWLKKNHANVPGVWLVLYKKNSGEKRISYSEAVEEALCFGWIDSKPNTLDETRFKLKFTPRKPKSVWAKTNKERVKRLIEVGLMTDAGMKKIEAAKLDGSWDSLNGIDSMQIPADFKKALSVNKRAKRNFGAFSDSSKKIILYWIQSAKRPETRERRVKETVSLAARNIKANHYRQ